MAVSSPEASSSRPLRERIGQALTAPVDSTILAYFRIVFGIAMAWHAAEHFYTTFFSETYNTNYHFTYWPFDWVQPVPKPAMVVVVLAMLLAAGFFTLGAYYRVSAAVLFVLSTYTYLLDQTHYLNHVYLANILTFLMIFLPANVRWSIDSKFDASLRKERVPAWTLWLLRFQIGVVYFYAGIAKMNGDWIKGDALELYLLNSNRGLPIFGHSLDSNEVFVLALAWAALLLDFLLVFLLLYRRTRLVAYIAAMAFHLVNSRVFHIGIFPWLAIASTAVWFPPDWPRRMLEELRQRTNPARVRAIAIGAVVVGALSAVVPELFNIMHVAIGVIAGGMVGYFIAAPERASAPTVHPDERNVSMGPIPRPLLVGLVVWVAFQLLMPWRSFVYPGNVRWTEEGHKFSWRMLLDVKEARGQTFYVRDPRTGDVATVDPFEHLHPRQADRMGSSPDMIIQFAHYLRDKAKDEGIANPEVRVHTEVAWNGRPFKVYIDPDADLAKEHRPWFGHADWIEPPPD